MQRFLTYLRDTRAEMKHVSWPTQRQALIYSLLVIAVSAFTALYIGVFDRVFTTLLNYLIHTF